MTEVHKTIPATVKASGEGKLHALASTWDEDLTRERVVFGAFSKSLRRWRDSGDALPVLWNHSSNDPRHFLGEVTEARETLRGLEVEAQLDRDDELARKAHKLLKRRAVKAMSIGYTVPAGGERRAEDGIKELTEIDLREVSLTLTRRTPRRACWQRRRQALSAWRIRATLSCERSLSRRSASGSTRSGSPASRSRDDREATSPTPAARRLRGPSELIEKALNPRRGGDG